MSFGFGATDVITISTLAWNLYKACRDSSEEFQRVAKEVKILHITLQETAELLQEYQWDLTPSRKERLLLIHESCSDTLKELQSLVQKYENLATPSQRVWDQMRWALQDVSELRQTIITTYTKLDAFNHTLSQSSHRVIIKKLDKYRNEVRAGLHEGSVVSTCSVDSLDTKEAWERLRRELESIGISKAVITENQEFITGWFRDALMSGELEEDVSTQFPTSSAPSLVPPSLLSGSTAYGDLRPVLEQSATLLQPISTVPSQKDPFGKSDNVSHSLDAIFPSSRKSSASSSKGPRSRLGSLMFKLFRSDTMLLDAASDGDVDRVANLIKNGANVNVKDRWGWAPMSMAAYGGYSDIAKILIEAGADLEYKDVDGDTPLDLATNKGHTAVVLVIQEELTRRAIEIG